MITDNMIHNNMAADHAHTGNMDVRTAADTRVCVATFATHAAASSFQKLCEMYWIPSHIMPVPRSLVSDCGNCVEFELRETFLSP